MARADVASSMATVTLKGNTRISCLTNGYIDEGWIVDTCASDHMIGN